MERGGERRSLRHRTIKGLSWRLVSTVGNFVSNFAIGVVLARLLPPEDFGLVGLALVVVGFGKLFADLGLGPALIQRQHLTHRHIRVGFTLSVLMGLVLTVVVHVTAPWAAAFMKDARLTDILQVLAFTFLFSSLRIVSVALMSRQLDFRRIMIAELVSYGIGYGGVAIVLALLDFGVWSLVYGSLIQNALELVLAYGMVRHTLKPLFAPREAKELASFGAGISLASIVNYAALQGDYIVIGRVLGPGPLGLYTRAYNLMKLPLNYFVKVLSTVLFPAASKIQHEAGRFQRVYLTSLTFTNFASIPCLLFVVILAREIVIGIYGPAWAGAVVPLQVLALFGIFRASYNNAGAFLRAKGSVYKILLSQVIYCAGVIGGSWAAALWMGINGVALAVGLAILVMWLLITHFSNRATGTSLRDFWKVHVPGLVIALPVGAACLSVKLLVGQLTTSPLLILLASALAGAVAAVAALALVPDRVLQGIPTHLLRLSEEYLSETWARRVETLLGTGKPLRPKEPSV